MTDDRHTENPPTDGRETDDRHTENPPTDRGETDDPPTDGRQTRGRRDRPCERTDGGVPADAPAVEPSAVGQEVDRRYRLFARVPTLLLARRNVSRAKLRSALAAAAIAIGVFAVATVGATGVAFKSQQLGTIESFGVGQVLVFPGPDAEGRFDAADLHRIEETVGEFGVVATSTERVAYDRRAGRESVTVTFLEDPRAQFVIDRGSLPPPSNWDRTAVVSAEFAREHGVAVGDRITLVRERRTPRGTEEYERVYRVTAILAPTDSFVKTPIYLPLEEARSDEFGRVIVTTGGASEARIAAERIDSTFNGRKDRITILEFTAIIELLTEITSGINRLLLLLGAVSMVVAAIAIANTMLMATIRRREEIGVLRAVGYRRRDILRVLLAEAAIIGVVGGVLGAVAAVGATAVANAVLGGELFAFTPAAALAFSPRQLAYFGGGVGFGVLVSLIAGFYPAWRAASERPVEALRG
ncbi:MAG: ABC transporter permease [Halobaculum sp.]